MNTPTSPPSSVDQHLTGTRTETKTGNSSKTLVIASRSSPLAMRQTQLVAALIGERLSVDCQIMPITTTADKMLDKPLADFGGKGVFVKELETALYQHRADFAVHSLKDVPGQLPPGLCLAAVLERSYPGDVLVLRSPLTDVATPQWPTAVNLDDLPDNMRIGSGSLRRQCQLLAYRPDWQISGLRGNIGTRLTRLQAVNLHGIVLARAGLERLANDSAGGVMLSELIESQRAMALSFEQMLPCPGQGALCVECLADNQRLIQQLSALHHAPTADCTDAERALASLFGADCHTPFAAYAHIDSGNFHLSGLVSIGKSLVRASASIASGTDEPQALAAQVYQKMRRAGAPAQLSTTPPQSS